MKLRKIASYFEDNLKNNFNKLTRYTFEKMMKGKPAYFELNLKLEPIEVDEDEEESKE